MSEEQLRAFLERLQGDTDLQKQLAEENADPLVIAKALGFDFDEADWEQLQRDRLSAEELESVAGGKPKTNSLGNITACCISLFC